MVEAVKSLDDVLLRAINGIEIGECKKEAVKEVSNFVDKNYIKKVSLSDINIIPAKDADTLYKQFGIEFQIKDGKFAGLRIERVKTKLDAVREA